MFLTCARCSPVLALLPFPSAWLQLLFLKLWELEECIRDLGAQARRRHFCREQQHTLIWRGLTHCRWVTGWEKGRSLNRPQFLAEAAHAAAGSACSRGMRCWPRPWRQRRDGERLLPPAVPLVAFALLAACSLAKPEEQQAQLSSLPPFQLQFFFLSLLPHGRSNPALSLPSYVSFLWLNNIIFFKIIFFFGFDELWRSPGLAVVPAAGQTGFPTHLWFALGSLFLQAFPHQIFYCTWHICMMERIVTLSL